MAILGETMNVFYFDARFNALNAKLDFVNALKYLENLYVTEPKIELLNSLVFASWYYYIEGDINQQPLTYDYKYFFEAWKKYVELGISNFPYELSFCLIGGYTLILDGFQIDPTFEQKGKELLKLCYEKSTDANLRLLASYFLRKSDKDFKSWNELAKIKKTHFSDESVSSQYFNEVIKKKW